MAQIVWTLAAAKSLEEIYGYIAEDNPQAAFNIVSGIYDKIQLLCDHTRIGQRYSPITTAKSGKSSTVTIESRTSSRRKIR